MKYFLLSLLLCFVFSDIICQSNGSVYIGETPGQPHAHTMMELNSSTKGLLIPRMSYESMQSIQTPTDGLLVYVTDNRTVNNLSGIWYFDAAIYKWVFLVTENTSMTDDLEEPIGTIAMYTGNLTDFYELNNPNGFEEGLGKPATKMKGWALCNGNNNTPDLRKKFIVGMGAEPVVVNQKGESNALAIANVSYQLGDTLDKLDKIKLNLRTMPEHSHKCETGSASFRETHKHKVTTAAHSHSTPNTHKNRGRGSVVRTSKWGADNHYDAKTDGSVSLNATAVSNNQLVDYTFPDGTLKTTGGINLGTVTNPIYDVETIENRPSYYVVAFIIKIGNSIYPTIQN